VANQVGKVILEFLTRGEDKIAKGWKGVSSGLSSLNKQVGAATSDMSLLSHIGGIVAPAALIGGAIKAISAYQEAEMATKALTSAVKTWGGTQGDVNALMEQTAELQKKTNYEADASNRIIAEGIQKGVAAGDIQRDLNGIYGLAAGVFNGDLNPAMDLYAKAMQGQTQMLGRQLPALKMVLDQLGENATAQQKQAAISKFLGEQYGKTATDMADKTIIAKHSFEDLTEEVGKNLKGALDEVSGPAVELLSTMNLFGVEGGAIGFVGAFANGFKMIAIEAGGFWEKMQVYADSGWKGWLALASRAIEAVIVMIQPLASLLGLDLAAPLKKARENMEAAMPALRDRLSAIDESVEAQKAELVAGEKSTAQIPGHTKALNDNTAAAKANTAARIEMYSTAEQAPDAALKNLMKMTAEIEKEIALLKGADELQVQMDAELAQAEETGVAKSLIEEKYRLLREQKAGESAATIMDQEKAMGDEMAGMIKGTFSAITQGANVFEAVWDNVIASIIDKLLSLAAMEIVQMVFGVATGGAGTGIMGFLGGLLGFAGGGTLRSGQLGWVGEAGPELALGLPGGGAHIIPMQSVRDVTGPAPSGGGQGGGMGAGTTQIFAGPNIHETRQSMMDFQDTHAYDAEKYNARRRI